MGEKFELGSYLKGIVPESDITEEQIEYIDIGLIDGDENNFYALSDVEALAANIETVGLQQPLRVRTSEADPVRVQIISGHRRKAALDKLVQDGNEKFRRVPVIREQVSGSAALQELKLIFANSDTRKITSADLSKQAERVEALLVQLREEGYDFPGRMRDHVAEACKVSRTKLANLKVIREHLIEDAVPAWEKGDLSEDAALKLARLPEEIQKRIVASNKKRNKGQVRWLYAGTIEAQAKRYEEVEKIQCQLYGCECTNQDNKKAYLESQGDNYYGSCHRSCCSGCDRLTSCKFVCPLLSSEVRAAKEQKRQENAQAKAEKDAKERPQTELQDMLWSRFAQARKDAGMSLEALFQNWDVKYPSTYIRDFEKYERGEGLKLGICTETPLNPYGGRISEAERLITLADTLDVSLDYLLGRTPCQNPEQMVFGSDLTENKPTWRTDAPPDGTKVLGKFELPGSPKRLIRTAYYLNGTYYFSQTNLSPIDTPCLGWILVPED